MIGKDAVSNWFKLVKKNTNNIKIKLAASYFFPFEDVLDARFLQRLTLEKLQRAHGNCVSNFKGLHSLENSSENAQSVDYYQQIVASYELLSRYIQGEETRVGASPMGKVIAVSGSKGGVGKSLIAANLAVLLSERGYKTVAVDLDLGGANLSLYLGESYLLEKTINDYLSKKYKTLADITIVGKSGVGIIGGDSSRLGSANIPFAQKIKLLRAIRNYDADCVVLDLGGNTSYNMLDFFLAADHKIVVTTSDSASYIGAYQFIKTSFYRQLNRIYGPEQPVVAKKNIGLFQIIKEATGLAGREDKEVKTVCQLLDRVKKDEPLDFQVIVGLALGFTPHLIVNKVKNNGESAQKVVKTIQTLSKKMLSVNVGCPGWVSRMSELDDMLRHHDSVVRQMPGCNFSKDLRQIVDAILFG